MGVSEQEAAPARPAELVGRSYTRARRHPWVIGKIQGWTIPLGPFTATQLGVLVVGLWTLVRTWEVWVRLGPFAALVLALPFALTWAVRHATIEGRAPLRAVGGYLALLAAPSSGWMRGRAVTEPGPATLTGVITIAPCPGGARTRPDRTAAPTRGEHRPASPTAPPPVPRGCAAARPRATPLQALLADPASPPSET